MSVPPAPVNARLVSPLGVAVPLALRYIGDGQTDDGPVHVWRARPMLEQLPTAAELAGWSLLVEEIPARTQILVDMRDGA